MISQPQMRMLHAAARDVGLGHDDLKASALTMFGAVSLKDLEPDQAGQMIDDLLEKSGKPKPMPAPIKPTTFTRFPRREDMGKKARMMTPVEQAVMEKAMNDLDAELKVILAARARRPASRPARSTARCLRWY